MLWMCCGPEKGRFAHPLSTLRKVFVSDMLTSNHC